MERTRLKEIKALFFLGANDTFLPGQLGLGGLLSETDREKIRSGGTKLSAGGKEQAYVQKFYLYMMLTKPEEELYLSFASASGGRGSASSGISDPGYQETLSSDFSEARRREDVTGDGVDE